MKPEFTLSVNGTTRETPSNLDQSLGELLEELRNTYNSKNSLISSIRVDNQEISERDEAALAILPLSDLSTVELTTSHPRELAEETLQILIPFAENLTELSQSAANLFEKGEHPSQELARLFDGIETFSEALLDAKKILNISELGPTRILEIDLLSVMQDVLEAYHKDNQEYLVNLLRTHLPESLRDWSAKGLPAILSSRDS